MSGCLVVPGQRFSSTSRTVTHLVPPTFATNTGKLRQSDRIPIRRIALIRGVGSLDVICVEPVECSSRHECLMPFCSSYVVRGDPAIGELSVWSDVDFLVEYGAVHPV